MAKQQLTDEDHLLIAELGVEIDTQKASSRSPREERIIAGFEEIAHFYEENKRLPIAENKDIFERLYAMRLQKIRNSEECQTVLADLDQHELLKSQSHEDKILDDHALLAELGVFDLEDNDIMKLTHVKKRSEVRAAEEIAKREPCLDFKTFKALFVTVQKDLKTGIRQGRRFEKDASIEKGMFFILAGQITYVAEVGKPMKASNGAADARLRVIYDNGTESDLLMRSLQRALYKDKTGRRITDPSAGPLFADFTEEDDIETGTIYILRSQSNHPFIQENRTIIHKIGVTGGAVEKRIANTKFDPTFLMAEVEIVRTYTLSNMSRRKFESLIHKFFETAKLNIEIKDRFGIPIIPQEWFFVPLFIIEESIEKIQDGSIVHCFYDPTTSKIIKHNP